MIINRPIFNNLMNDQVSGDCDVLLKKSSSSFIWPSLELYSKYKKIIT